MIVSPVVVNTPTDSVDADNYSRASAVQTLHVNIATIKRWRDAQVMRIISCVLVFRVGHIVIEVAYREPTIEAIAVHRRYCQLFGSMSPANSSADSEAIREWCRRAQE